MGNLIAKFNLKKFKEIKVIFKIQKVVSPEGLATKVELNNEIQRATQKENELQQQITNNTQRTEQVENTLQTVEENISLININKANKSETYTKGETNSLLNQKQDKGDYATNSRINTIVDSFECDIEVISTHIDDIYTNKADKSNTYTKEEVDDKVAHVTVDAYTKEETNTLLNTKANQSALEETNNNLDALTGEVENIAGELDSKADKREIPTIPTNISYFNNDSGYINSVKTINGQDIIGTGDIEIKGGGVSSFSELEGNPYDNKALADEFDSLDIISLINMYLRDSTGAFLLDSNNLKLTLRRI